MRLVVFGSLSGTVLRASLAATALSVVAAPPSTAQEASKASPREVITCPPAIADIATCYTARDASGAWLLAAMPKAWNGDLIVSTHGGPSLVPLTATYSVPNLTRDAIEVRLGYGWIESAYRREGYGVRMAATDADMSRRYFSDQFGKPKHTILHGASYGGLVALKTLEVYGRADDGSGNYDGAYLSSPILAAPTRGGYEYRADLHTVYQYFCRNLPRPDEPAYPVWMGLPAESKLTPTDIATRVDECTGVGHPPEARTAKQKENLANILNVVKVDEAFLAFNMQQATVLFRSIVQYVTHGANPWTNVGIVYKGSSDDTALNRDVERFSADPSAVADLRFDGEPTGTLSVPVVILHSMNDPLAQVEAESVFHEIVVAAGTSDYVVQAYGDEPSHVGQSNPEHAAAINSLMQWIDKGIKPTPQSIASACEQVRMIYDGPCRFHPDYQPKSFDTRFYPRTAAPH